MKKLALGNTASLSKKFSCSDVEQFAEMSGDKNPIHLNDKAAALSVFKKRVVHGMLTASLISGVLGSVMPGEGTIYLEQDLQFCKPVYIGDLCTAKVNVAEVLNKEKGIYRLKTWVQNQNNEIVIEGFAVVRYC